jgi:hypothetical protein
VLRKITTAMAAAALLVGVGLVGTASAAPMKPALSCAYGHICGQDAYGHSFDFYYCDIQRLNYMVGQGTLDNNQTPGTEAVLYADSQGSVYTYSVAPDRWEVVNWTDVWWIAPC